MESSNVYFLVLSLIVSYTIPKFVSAQSAFRSQWCSDTTYTPNSTYQSNLQAVLNSLSTDTRITYGFYNMTAGHEPDKVSSLALCRGYVPVSTCRNCIKNSASLLINTVCPNQKEGFGYSGYCSVFFSNRSIYGEVQDVVDPWLLVDKTPVTNTRGFSDSLSLLMQSLKNRAGSGNSEKKYAADKANTSGGQSLYGLVQCTPDLSKRRCMQCIQGLIDYLPSCCVQSNYTASGAMMDLPNCFVRYNINSFYGNVPNEPLPTSSVNISSNAPIPGRKSGKTHIVSIISIALGVSTMLLATSIIFSILIKKRKSRNSWMVKFSKDEIAALRSLQFSLGAIKQATQNFSEDYKLGEGGFGSVYKGVLRDGQEIAVKKLVTNSGQSHAEFKNEILILAKLQHRNLVRLLGFCLHGKEMILIYELVANRSLDKFIFDPLSRQSMQWETRYKIINGIARGILYLHENSRLKIIHRDLKAANILLDEDFYPKIADFGKAMLFNFDQTETLASKIVGTLGYISPEYALQRQVSVKSDVYSFGVLVLEIVSGQRITSFSNDEENQENLLSFAWRNWTDGNAWNLVDPVIPPGSSTEILRCIHIGLLCVQDNPVDRPTMSAVDLMLSSDSVTLQVPAQPAFCTESQNLPDMLKEWSTMTKSSIRSEGGSINNVSITELHPR
ncbi:putative receptor-like protein kinase At4g00960 isoform X2 [Chenopodium quinoa]|uniref:putative receptor-like protein kinase At4g00960 isoform X2 n=1 Tax=Chenopodium quinoa TaxID=63459 RepID=UPI000B794D9A|nr:putative receptor-like protein kinase At4g00960 isoform X2 [Chenopodium quinoa]